MPVTLELNPQTEQSLKQQAALQGVSTEVYISTILESVSFTENLDQASEDELLQRLSLGFSEADWQHYHDLRRKLNDQSLTDDAHRQLLELVDRLENANAKRMAVVSELARRRKQSLETVMADLKLSTPEPY